VLADGAAVIDMQLAEYDRGEDGQGAENQECLVMP